MTSYIIYILSIYCEHSVFTTLRFILSSNVFLIFFNRKLYIIEKSILKWKKNNNRSGTLVANTNVLMM